MAINDSDNQNTGAAKAGLLGDVGTASRPVHANNVQEEPRSGRTFRNTGIELNSRLSRAIGRNTASESTKRLLDALRKEAGEGSDFKILLLDEQAKRVALSALVVCLPHIHHGKKLVAAQALIIESNRRFAPQVENIGGQKVESLVFAGNVGDNVMWERVVETVREHFGADVEVVPAGFSVIHRETDPSDQAAMHNLLFYSTAALSTVMVQRTDPKGEKFNVGWVSNDNLSAHIDFNPLKAMTPVGLPIRSDVSVVVRARMRESANFIHQQEQDITRLDGYVTLHWKDPDPVTVPGQVPVTQRFVPRLNISLLEPMTDAINLELMLMALSTSTILTRDYAWAGVFRPRHGMGNNPRNLGAISLDIPQLLDANAKSKIIDTSSTAFDDKNFHDLLHTTVFNNVVVGMDIEETGPLSWLQLLLLDAAQGSRAANEAIVQAANNLTNGHFQEFYNGEQVAYDTENRIHLGYWVDEHDIKRDIREIDYLALLNLLKADGHDKAIAFANTFDVTAKPAILRLNERREVYERIIGEGNVRFTGYAHQINISPAFLQALVDGQARAGLNIRPENLNQMFSTGMQRGNPNIMRHALGANVGAQLFSHGSPYGNYNGGVQTPTAGRFRGW